VLALFLLGHRVEIFTFSFILGEEDRWMYNNIEESDIFSYMKMIPLYCIHLEYKNVLCVLFSKSLEIENAYF